MKFSIVTPVFNGMPWLPEAVESVARQRSDPSVEVEHLVFDGGSTDGSREWLAAHKDLGFEAVLEPDRGQTDALIKGFTRATGDILGWVNADDMLEPDGLRVVADAFSRSPQAVLVAGACLLIDGSGNVTGLIPTPPVPSFDGLLHNPANPPQPATFVRASAYRQSGGLDPRYDLAMDVDLWMKVARIGPVVFLSDRVLARFRVHASAKSVVGMTAAVRQDFGVRRKYGMSLRTRAAYTLITQGWIRPPLRPLKHVLVRFVAWTLRVRS